MVLNEICQRYNTTENDTLLLDRLNYEMYIRNDTSYIKEHMVEYIPYNLYVIPEHGLVLCLVPKTGITSYISLLKQYTKKFQRIHPNERSYDIYNRKIYDQVTKYGIYRARNISTSQLIYSLQNYKKVIMTRHPFNRLFSFYKDKIAGPDCIRLFYAFAMRILTYTRNETILDKETACKSNITFEEFVEYYKEHSGEESEEHLRRISHQCSPCTIKYGMVVRTETSRIDQEYIAKYVLHRNKLMHYDTITFKANARLNDDYGKDGRLDMYDNLNVSAIQWMKQFYKDDLGLFGYKVELTSSGLASKCFMNINGTVCC